MIDTTSAFFTVNPAAGNMIFKRCIPEFHKQIDHNQMYKSRKCIIVIIMPIVMVQ